jgi:hypothetical protein
MHQSYNVKDVASAIREESCITGAAEAAQRIDLPSLAKPAHILTKTAHFQTTQPLHL